MKKPDKDTPEYCCMELKEYVQENPIRVLLAALGLGLLLAALLRPRKPARAADRALELLEEIEDRVKEIAEPAYHRAVEAAEKHAAAFKHKAAESLEELDIPSAVKMVRKRLRDLFG